MTDKLKEVKATIHVKKVEDHPFWYHVSSETHDTPNTVQLDARGGNGECNCHDFTFTCTKNLQKGLSFVDYGEKGKPNPNRTRCKHIKVALKFWSDNLLKQIAWDKKGKYKK